MADMASQWPMMLATLLTGMAGWLLVAACVHLAAPGASVRARVRPPQALAIALAIAGLVAGVVVQGVMLGSVGTLFQLLSRPGSRYFSLMISLIAALVMAIAVAVASAQGAGSTAMRVLAALGALAGVAVAVTCGFVFLPSTFTAWNTPLLAVAVCGCSAAGGASLYLLLVGALSKPDGAPLAPTGAAAPPHGRAGQAAAPRRRPLRVRLALPIAVTALLCAVALACTLPFLAVTGTRRGDSSAAWLAVCVAGMAGALACAVVAWLARSHKGACVALALVATALGILAAVALRMYMGDFATSAFTQVSSMSSPAGRL